MEAPWLGECVMVAITAIGDQGARLRCTGADQALIRRRESAGGWPAVAVAGCEDSRSDEWRAPAFRTPHRRPRRLALSEPRRGGPGPDPADEATHPPTSVGTVANS